ncbi:MAG: hypothetical protein ABIR36_08910 [Nitrospiraceae bacterium]
MTSRVLLLSFALMTLIITGCSSSGTLGIVTRSTADAGGLLKAGRSFQDLGPAEGTACRHFVLAIIPWGDSTFSTAVDNALQQKGGDALINVTVTSSLYGFIPIYNVYSFTCTEVKGVAVKFQ